MASYITRTVPNIIFQTVCPANTLQIYGESNTVTTISDLVTTYNYSVRDLPSTPYITLANLLNKMFLQEGEPEADPESVKDIYYSSDLRAFARLNPRTTVIVDDADFKAKHRGQRGPEARAEVCVSYFPALLPELLNLCIRKFWGRDSDFCVGVVEYEYDSNTIGHKLCNAQTFLAHALQYETLWLAAHDYKGSRGWVAILPPVPQLQFTMPDEFRIAAGNCSGSQARKNSEIVPSYQIENRTNTSQDYVVIPGFDSSIASRTTRRSSRQRKAQPDNEPEEEEEGSDYVDPRRTTSRVARHIDNAPSFETDLPWELMQDITLDELIVYYPEHVFNWPGLALLYNQYRHRLATPRYELAAVATTIDQSRGVKNPNAKRQFSSRIRQWITLAGKEICGASYRPDELQHHQSLYHEIQHRQIRGNVMDLLEKILQQVSSRLSGELSPALPLAEVGKFVKIHPKGHFADRVQAAMRGEKYLLPAPAEVPYHQMVIKLEDRTQNMQDRLNERTILPEWNSEENRPNPEDCLVPLSGQLERFNKINTTTNVQQAQTYMQQLEASGLQREQIIEEYWPDLKREAFLWVFMKYPASRLADMLPREAIARQYGGITLKEARRRVNNKYRKGQEIALKDRIRAEGHDPDKVLNITHNLDGSIKEKVTLYKKYLTEYNDEKKRLESRVPGKPTHPGSVKLSIRTARNNKSKQSSIPDSQDTTSKKRAFATLNFGAAAFEEQLVQPPQSEVQTMPVRDPRYTYLSVNQQEFSALRIPTTNGAVAPQWWQEARMQQLRTQSAANRLEFSEEYARDSLETGYDVEFNWYGNIDAFPVDWSHWTTSTLVSEPATTMPGPNLYGVFDASSLALDAAPAIDESAIDPHLSLIDLDLPVQERRESHDSLFDAPARRSSSHSSGSDFSSLFDFNAATEGTVLVSHEKRARNEDEVVEPVAKRVLRPRGGS